MLALRMFSLSLLVGLVTSTELARCEVCDQTPASVGHKTREMHVFSCAFHAWLPALPIATKMGWCLVLPPLKQPGSGA